ncbi:winged helix-turn-helix transcriptional regulator [Streptomyces sp. NPDC056362]|uniref:winged helix-turn-helix transcriptional regulator n=1 Tax=unclassified Streptomyces TaxID=2593676 RepID=UPI0035E25A97
MDSPPRPGPPPAGPSPECAATITLVRDVLSRVGDRWTVLVVTALAEGPRRFKALHDRIDGISQRMLSQTLRALTRDGLVTRTAYAEKPPRVEYALTPLGRSLTGAVGHVVGWVRDHQGEIVRNREVFDGPGEEATRGAAGASFCTGLPAGAPPGPSDGTRDE